MATENDVLITGELIRELYVKLSKVESKKQLFREFDELTIIEIETILVIGLGEMKSMSQIAEALGVTLGTPTITVNRLVEKKFVERVRDIGDRRQVFVKLSEKGTTVFLKLRELKERLSAKVLETLEPDELKMLSGYLVRINRKLEEIMRGL